MTLEAADRLEIIELVTRADSYASARDADAYVALFTEDAVMEGAMGSAHGRAALRETVAQVWAAEPAATLHLTLNPLIDSSGDYDPRVDSVMLMVSADTPPVIIGLAKVRQVVTRSPSGWRISSRVINR